MKKTSLVGVVMLALPAAASAENPLILQDYVLGASLGGGVVGFVDEEVNDVADPGGAWDIRLGFNTRGTLAIEGAYVGSLQSLDALGLDSGSKLLGTGVEGNLKLNVTAGAFQPYGLLGAGWTRYKITGSSVNTSSVRDRASVASMPVGVGVGYRFDNVVLDLRGTYRLTSDNDLFTPTTTGNTDLDTWSATFKAGFEM